MGVKNVWSARSVAWCSDVVSFNPACRWCVDGVVSWVVHYWFKIKPNQLDNYSCLSDLVPHAYGTEGLVDMTELTGGFHLFFPKRTHKCINRNVTHEMVQICNLPSADRNITHNGQPGYTMNQRSSYLWHLLPLLTLATLRIISNSVHTFCPCFKHSIAGRNIPSSVFNTEVNIQTPFSFFSIFLSSSVISNLISSSPCSIFFVFVIPYLLFLLPIAFTVSSYFATSFPPEVSTLNFRLLMAILLSAYIHRPTSLTNYFSVLWRLITVTRPFMLQLNSLQNSARQ